MQLLDVSLYHCEKGTLIGKEKSILFIFHHMYSEIPGTEFNY